jgi:hypothetical protein
MVFTWNAIAVRISTFPTQINECAFGIHWIVYAQKYLNIREAYLQKECHYEAQTVEVEQFPK